MRYNDFRAHTLANLIATHAISRPVAQRFSRMTETGGQRLITALTKPGDPYELTLLIEEAGQVKDFLDRLRPVLNGDRDAWLEVNIGAKTVEVVVTNPLVQYRQLTEQLRKLLAEVHRRRGSAPGVPSDVNDPTNV